MKPVNQDTKARYDDMPYSSYAYQYSAPEQLATVASLFGLPSGQVATARVPLPSFDCRASQADAPPGGITR